MRTITKVTRKFDGLSNCVEEVTEVVTDERETPIPTDGHAHSGDDSVCRKGAEAVMADLARLMIEGRP